MTGRVGCYVIENVCRHVCANIASLIKFGLSFIICN
jgi:hypothetical protein